MLYAALVGCALVTSSRLAAQQPTNATSSRSAAFTAQDPAAPATGSEAPLPTDSDLAGFGAPRTGSLASMAYHEQQPQSAQNGAPIPQYASGDQQGQQTKRILGIIPNFRAISANTKLPPQSVKEKFMTASEDSFDYSSIFIPALLAGYSMATDATPEFHQGAAGYGRYFWHAAVDQTTENYMVEFVVPSITHEDTRYYTLGTGGFLKRTGYALSRALITRSDSGKEVFNASEVIGSGAASGISTLYYPSRQRSIGNTGKEWGIDVGVDGISFFAKEFWPDVNRWLTHGAKSSAAAQQ